MKKWEKEILQKQIQNEANVTSRIEAVYKKALDEINDKIMVLQAKEQTKSVIYQLKYQQALQKQVESVYSKMAGTWYQTIDEYLNDCYEDAFYSTMYALHQEGIPTIIPFNQKEVAQAAAQDVGLYGQKLSQKLYDDAYNTAKKTVGRISKGIAMNSSYATIALEIAKTGTATVNQALRITRTEAHRIHEEVKFKTINQAADKGADIVKQWDASIDRRTRKSHAALDGQLREIDQPFKSPTSGHTAMYPGGFGIASEDINCRCVVLQRARWALDKSELDKYVGDLDGMTDKQLQELADKLGVSKDELIKKSNGVIEADGSINHRIKAQNYNQFKKKYQTKAKIAQAQQAAQDDLQKITDLQNAVDDAQNKLNALPNKTYSGIWKDDVSISDYEFKKNTIQSKKDYYLQKLTNGGLTDAEKAKYLKYLDDLDEFETEGAKYLKAKNDLQDLKNQLKVASGTTSSGGVFADEAYGQRKTDAWTQRFRNKEAADKYYRSKLDSEWKNYTEHEKYATWEYTHNSNPINKSLSGYHESWNRYDFKGLGNTDWGHEDGWRHLSSNSFISKFGKNGTSNVDYHRVITDLTNAIDKSVIDKDVFLVRGGSHGGAAGLFETIMPYDDAIRYLNNGDISSLKTLIEGNTITNHAFTSTGIASGAGFSGNVKYKIYAPKGTKGIYAEPQSYYGNTINGEQIYKAGKAYSSVGGEAEIILQRGTSYRVTNIDYSNGSYTIEMEVVDQPDYFKFGDEETFNGGLTRHKT